MNIKKYNAEAYLKACAEGEEIVAFCRENGISDYYTLMNSQESFPQDRRDEWFKRLCSPGFLRFLRSRGIK